MTAPKAKLQIFDENHSYLDDCLYRRASEFISAELEVCEKPTLKNFAAQLGIEPKRLTRILKALGLWAEYRQARKRAYKKYQ